MHKSNKKSNNCCGGKNLETFPVKSLTASYIVQRCKKCYSTYVEQENSNKTYLLQMNSEKLK